MKKIIYLLLLVIVTSSCATKLKQQVRAHNYFNKYPNELAEICAIKYPPEVKYVQGKPVLVQGKPIVTRDTVQITVDCPDGTKVKADCPPNETSFQTDTITIRDTAYVANTALINTLTYTISALQGKVDSQVSDIKELKATIRKRNIQLASIGVGVLLISIFGIYRYLKIK